MYELDPRHASVLQAVADSTDEMVRLLQQLVQVPSIGGSEDESAIQDLLARTFENEGLAVDAWRVPLDELAQQSDAPGVEVARPAVSGLVGRLPGRGGGPSLLFNGHVDVVPVGDLDTWTDGDPFSGRLDAGRVYGRGACDMKGGLVAALWAIRALRRSGLTLLGDVLLASVQAEEDGGMGSFALLQRGWRADACVIPEPTGLDLVPACAGALTFRLRVRGHATHASRRTEGVSAIEQFWPIWRALQELERVRNASVDLLMRRWPMPYALSIGSVHSGMWPSSVPDLLVAEGRLGVALDESTADARQALESAVTRACAADPWLRDHPVEVEWWGGQFASGRLPASSDLMDRMRSAHAIASKTAPATHEPSVWGAPYGSDLRLLVGLGSIPTLHYGPGDAALAHGPDEWVPVSEVLRAAGALAILALDFVGCA